MSLRTKLLKNSIKLHKKLKQLCRVIAIKCIDASERFRKAI
ncbi:MAG: hypothetical protein QXK54_07255 [Ignisphaera sp.]